MGTLARYPQRVAKPKYTPPNDEVAAKLDRMVELFRRQQEIWEEYKRALGEVGPNGDDVPIAHIAERLGVERKTVYRHLGRPMK